ncbi:oxidoreductase family [Pyrenophora tritici-repentis]|nr:oxidoreductase family [Pyrenophora tritici-repentis]
MASTGIALIGSGIFAKEEHLPAILAADSLSLKAIYSRSRASVEGLASGLSEGVGKELELYSDDTEERPEYITKALAAGKYVLAEKPIAKTWPQRALLDWISTNVPSGGPTLHCRKLPLSRLLYYAAAEIKSWAAFSVSEHLSPVDTVDATMQLSNGASGTASISFGTQFSGSEYAFACEKGTVVVTRAKVAVKRDGEHGEVKEFKDEGSGVKPEVAAWGKGLQEGKMDPRQSAEEGLRDLEVLEAMLTSGEKGGAPVELKL